MHFDPTSDEKNGGCGTTTLRRRAVILTTAVVLITIVHATGVAAARPSRGWTVEPADTAPLYANLQAVSCADEWYCVAVGSSYDRTTGNGVPLIEERRGTTWRAVAAPVHEPGALDAVSCPSSVACFASGFIYDRGDGIVRTLVEAWDGRQWKRVATPNPVGSTWSELRGVSCVTAYRCVAVGYTVEPQTMLTKTLSETFDGSRWTIATTPSPAKTPQALNILNAVSCERIGACVAVGYSESPLSHSLIEVLRGNHWTVAHSPEPLGATGLLLSSVSCAAGACTAVGSSSDARGPRTLVERSTGRGWTIVPAPSPRTGGAVFLNGVSCATPTQCTTVGAYYDSPDLEHHLRTLIERSDGAHWTIEPSPNPSATLSELGGVSCVRPDKCVAVGSFVAGTPQALVLSTGSGRRW